MLNEMERQQTPAIIFYSQGTAAVAWRECCKPRKISVKVRPRSEPECPDGEE